MKTINIFLVSISLLLLAVACEPMEDINTESDNSYTGPVRRDLVYELTAADYKAISKSALEDALTAGDYDIASSILEGNTAALAAEIPTYYIPEVLNDMQDMFGYAKGSLNAVTYKYRTDDGEAIIDSTSRYYKFSGYAWMLFPEPGYLCEFNDGVKDEVIDIEGWTQLNLGTSTDLSWVYKMIGNEMCACGTAYKGTGSGGYDMWFISPGLNIDEVLVKANLKFKTAYGYANGSQLKVYIMDNPDPNLATIKDELVDGAAIVEPEVDTYNTFMASGEIDLSSYSGTIYVGFEYIAGEGQTTNFYLDDFTFDYLEVEE